MEELYPEMVGSIFPFVILHDQRARTDITGTVESSPKDGTIRILLTKLAVVPETVKPRPHLLQNDVGRRRITDRTNRAQRTRKLDRKTTTTRTSTGPVCPRVSGWANYPGPRFPHCRIWSYAKVR